MEQFERPSWLRLFDNTGKAQHGSFASFDCMRSSTTSRSWFVLFTTLLRTVYTTGLNVHVIVSLTQVDNSKSPDKAHPMNSMFAGRHTTISDNSDILNL